MPETTAPIIRQHHGIGLYSVAVYDRTEMYRYYLKRTWDDGLPLVAFVGLNPSTATEQQDDPTVRRCQTYARDWGYGGFLMLNAFALRSTDPRGLRDVRDPVGPENDVFLLMGVKEAAKTVVCWGNHGAVNQRHLQMRKLLQVFNVECFVRTATGFPNHPLYLKKTLRPVPYEWGSVQ